MINRGISQKVLLTIKKSRHILLAIHVSPDADSLASCLAMDVFLRRIRKKTEIISYSQISPKFFLFPGVEKIKISDFAKINFVDFDLFIALDSAQERMITRSKFPQKFPLNFQIINLDHHETNTKFGNINLIEKVSSTAELLYVLFTSWKVKIDRKLAKFLLWGIIADTGCFQYPLTSARTLRIAAELMDKDASLKEMVLLNFRSYSLKTLKYWGKILENLQIDESGKFVWSKISFAEKEELGIDPTEIEGAASLFAPIISGTDFGIILSEEAKDLVRGSLRSRRDFAVSDIAVKLGGGGHREAAGFTLEMPLEEAEKKVLEVARMYLKNKS